MKNIFSFLFVMICLTSCLSNSAQNTGNGSTIAATEYQKILSSQKDIQLIDVRTPEEFSKEHLQNAVNIDFNADDFKTKIATLDKAKKTMIYCLSGGRSGSAIQIMTDIGFKDVTNLKGGILQWKAQNLPLSSATNNTVNTGWKGMSKEDYKKLISGNIPVLVDFHAKWCGPCKQLKPILADIEKEYPTKIKVVAIDIDENKSLAESMYIRNIPLLIYHENGEVVLNQEGFLEKEDLIKLLKLKK